jgi:hypothetical protein
VKVVQQIYLSKSPSNAADHPSIYNPHYNASSTKISNTIAFSPCLLQLIPHGSTSMFSLSPSSRLHPCTILVMEDGSARQYNFLVLLLLLIPPRVIPMRLPPPITVVAIFNVFGFHCSLVTRTSSLCKSPRHNFGGAR